jgi:hypothetical protein
MVIVLSGIAIAVSLIALWAGMARDGQVRSFLRNDDVQAYYVVISIAVLALGVVSLIAGVANLL